MTDLPSEHAEDVYVETHLGGYVAQHDWQSPRPLTATLYDVLDTIPAVSMRDEDALYECIDIEALEPLFQNGKARPDAEVRFGFQGCLVVISGNGTITVQPDSERLAPGTRRRVGD